MDVEAELQTYKHSRQGLDEMYNEARRQLREEAQLRQVSVPCMNISTFAEFRCCLSSIPEPFL